jgi:hypothetical protein
MWNWLNENKEWLFQGAAILIPIAAISGIWAILRSRRNRSEKEGINQRQSSGDKSTNIQAGHDVSIRSPKESRDDA